MRSVDIEATGRLLARVARDEILARFGTLAPHEVRAKSSDGIPHDVVTAADLAMEERLTPELRALLPGSVVVGEEATALDPSLLDAVRGDAPVWLLDPLDGTRNFSLGRDSYGSMLALVVARETVASWIYLPPTDVLFVAERGAGAFRDGVRLAAAEPAPQGPREGVLYGRATMPAEERERLEARAAKSVRRGATHESAAVEYTNLAEGRRDFAVYHRLYPWDHAPGALLVTEAGGASRHADGSPYRPTDRNRLTLVVRHASLFDELRAALF